MPGNDTIEPRELRYVTIKTKEGSYEAGLLIDNANYCPLRGGLNLTRYRAPEPPRLLRIIPKYYRAKQLPRRQVLKFDIREPEPYRQLWRRKQLNPEHTPQESICEAKDNIKTEETNRILKKNTRQIGRVSEKTSEGRKNMTLSRKNNNHNH